MRFSLKTWSGVALSGPGAASTGPAPGWQEEAGEERGGWGKGGVVSCEKKKIRQRIKSVGVDFIF